MAEGSSPVSGSTQHFSGGRPILLGIEIRARDRETSNGRAGGVPGG